MTKDGREYRDHKTMQFRALEREEGSEALIVEGYATTFDVPYELFEDYWEVIDRHALDKADMSDVIFQLNHKDSVFARQRNNTLALSIDDHGLFIRADLSGSQGGRELYESIKNGLIDRMSWGFTLEPDGWEYDKKTRTSTITRVKKVYDVSAVSIPANDGTEIKARSYLDGVIEGLEQQELLQSRQEEQRKRIALALEITTRGRINVREMDGGAIPLRRA